MQTEEETLNGISNPNNNNSDTDPDADADISESDGSDDDRNHKHKRRESPPLLLNPNSHQNDQNAPHENPPSPLNKKRVRPTNQFDRRERNPNNRFRPNNNNNFNQNRNRGRLRNPNPNPNPNSAQWGPHLIPPQLDMHDLALLGGPGPGNILGGPGPGNILGGPGPYGFFEPVPVPVPMHHHHAMMERQLAAMPRQRCADFEERGFCLRGDMCPMEHGVNRIVVDDVQSLSQLKLLGPGPKPGMPIKDPSRQNPNLQSVISTQDADLYDPDQPLWNHNNTNNPNPNGSKPDPLSTGTSTGTDDPSSSVWGRIASKNPKPNPNPNSQENETLNGTPNRPKAARTLFICGVPQKDNRADLLFSHFKKFGTVIDIYVPNGTERAFVQFSKREEAESAFGSPDAVMGNRFIRVLWANRDRISDETGTSTYQSKPVQITAPGSDKRRGNLVNMPVKGAEMSGNNGVKVAQIESPVLKKTESMDLLEELRKKQEDLARKRIEFRKQLAKLEKQASIGKKGENSSAGTSSESPKPSVRKGEKQEATQMATQKSATKDPFTPLSNSRPNRYKIDNRPVQFRILSLPQELHDVSMLKEHFSQFGELASVTLEEKENDKEALVTYTKHEPAERAFLSGPSLKGHTLSFEWVKNSNTLPSKIATTPPNSKTPPLQTLNPKLERLNSSPVQTELERSSSVSKTAPVQTELERSSSVSKTATVQTELENSSSVSKTATVQDEMERSVSPVNDGAVAETNGADVAKSGAIHE